MDDALGGTGVEGNESNRVQAQDWIPREERTSNFLQYAKYRYCLVMENKKFPGYITEKIILAFLGGCIPIYYGDTERTFDIFNNKSFLFYNAEEKDSASKVLKRVSELEANPDEYDKMLKEPILLHGNATVEKYLSGLKEFGEGRLRFLMRRFLGITE